MTAAEHSSSSVRGARSRLRAIARPVDWLWILLLVGVYMEYVRPTDSYVRFLAPLKIPGLITLALAVGFFISDKSYLRRERLNWFVLAFWILVSLSVLYAPNTRWTFNTSLALFWVLVGFVFPINIALNTQRRVFQFIKWWIGAQALLAVYVLFHEGHGPGSFLVDENDAALALNMALPYTLYAAFFPDISRVGRMLLLLTALLIVAAIGVAGSRGGVLGFAAVIMTMVLLSKKPLRNSVVIAGIASVAIVILLRVLPATYVNDMKEMDDPNDETRDERLWSWSVGWVMYKENPVLGVGAGNYPWTNANYATKSPMYRSNRKILGGRVAHSLYFTLLPELGTVGLIIFAALLKMILSRCLAMRRPRGSENSGSEVATIEARLKFRLLANAILASLAAYLVSGAFISVLYYPPFWHLVGICAATHGVWIESFTNSGEIAKGQNGKSVAERITGSRTRRQPRPRVA